jgi:hypothetical protein
MMAVFLIRRDLFPVYIASFYILKGTSLRVTGGMCKGVISEVQRSWVKDNGNVQKIILEESSSKI